MHLTLIRKYTYWSVITFVALIFFFYELEQYRQVLIQKETHLT